MIKLLRMVLILKEMKEITDYLQKKMQDAELFNQWTLQGVLDELDTIELFEAPGHGRVLGEVTTKQKELYEALGVAPPSL